MLLCRICHNIRDRGGLSVTGYEIRDGEERGSRRHITLREGAVVTRRASTMAGATLRDRYVGITCVTRVVRRREYVRRETWRGERQALSEDNMASATVYNVVTDTRRAFAWRNIRHAKRAVMVAKARGVVQRERRYTAVISLQCYSTLLPRYGDICAICRARVRQRERSAVAVTLCVAAARAAHTRRFHAMHDDIIAARYAFCRAPRARYAQPPCRCRHAWCRCYARCAMMIILRFHCRLTLQILFHCTHDNSCQ